MSSMTPATPRRKESGADGIPARQQGVAGVCRVAPRSIRRRYRMRSSGRTTSMTPNSKESGPERSSPAGGHFSPIADQSPTEKDADDIRI